MVGQQNFYTGKLGHFHTRHIDPQGLWQEANQLHIIVDFDAPSQDPSRHDHTLVLDGEAVLNLHQEWGIRRVVISHTRV